MSESSTDHSISTDPADQYVAGSLGRRLRKSAALVASPAVHKGSLALLDQALVSGTRFFTTVLVGRACGPEELGVYSLAFTFVVLMHGAQESLITTPYTLYSIRMQGARRARYAGSAIVQCGLLSGVAMLLFAAMALILSTGMGTALLSPVMWVLVGMIPLMMLREFGRRFAFADLRVGHAVLLDLLASAIQIGGLLWLVTTDRLTAGNAYLVIGFSCGVAGLAWLLLVRNRFQLHRRQWAAAIDRNWKFGRWVFAGQTTTQLTWYSTHWLIAFALGATSTGIFAACMTLVLFSNPFILGVNNLLAPFTAQSFVEGGKAKVRHVVCRAMLFMSVVMGVFCVLVALLGEWMMHLLFENNAYAGHMLTLNALALSIAVLAVNLPVDNGLWAIQRPDLNFKASLLGLVATLAATLSLISGYGIAGAAIGLLIGSVVESIVRVTSFFRIVRDSD